MKSACLKRWWYFDNRCLPFLILWIFPLEVSANENDKTDVWSRLAAIARLDAGTQLSELRDLEMFCRKKGFTTDSVYTNLLAMYSYAEYASGDRDKAIRRMSNAIKIAEKNPGLNPPLFIGKYYFYLAEYENNGFDYQSRIEHLRKSLEYSKQAKIDRWQISAQTCLYLSFLYKEIRDYSQSLEVATLGIGLSLAQKDSALWLNNLNERIESLGYLGRFEEAYSDSKQLLAYADGRVVSYDLGRFLKIQADVSYQSNDLARALEYYKKAEAIFIKTRDSLSLGVVYVDLHQLTNRMTGARVRNKYFQKAKSLVGNSSELSRLYTNEGIALRALGENVEALRMFQEALRNLPLLNCLDTNLTVNPSFALLTRYYRRDHAFFPVLEKANSLLVEGKREKGRSYFLVNAIATYLLVDSLTDIYRQEHSGSTIKLFWRDKTRSMYENAVEASFLANDVDRAHFFFEKSRSVLLNDQLNELSAGQKLSPAEQQTENIFRTGIIALQTQLEKTKGGAESPDLRERLIALQQEQESFIRNLEKTNPQYYAYKYDNKIPSIGEVRKNLLKDGQTLLSFFVGDRAVYGLAIDANRVVLRKINLASYQILVRRFNSLVSDRNAQNTRFGAYMDVSSKLYTLLVKPFGIPEGSRVIVSSDGDFLPFSALSKSATTADYLVNHYAFSYTYSASFLSKAKRQQNTSWFGKAFMGMAPEHFSPDLKQAPLQGSIAALKGVAGNFLRTSDFTGAEATRSAFLKYAAGYRVVQLLTHASADSLGSVPTLYFADSTLKLNELKVPSKQATELMILSACQTGVGKNQRGEGVFSLARGFAGIGVPSVLTTLWSVESDPVYKLTQLFFDAVKNKVPLDLALQRAQMSWLKGAGREDQLPVVWAGIVLAGNAEPVDTGISRFTGYLTLVLSLGLAGVLTVVLRRRKLPH